MGSKFDKKIFLDALPNLLLITPATTLEIWQNVDFVCRFDISMFLQKNYRFGDCFSITKAKLGGPILESSLQFRNSRKHFHRRASFGAEDYGIGKKAIFVRFRRFLIVGTKIAIWNKSYRFRDINCRFEDKSPFKRQTFIKGYYRLFFIVGAKIAVLRQKLPFSGH